MNTVHLQTYRSFSTTHLDFLWNYFNIKFSFPNLIMDISCKHPIDQRPYIINLYHNQPCPTNPISTNEQTSEPLPTATSNDANKQLEPVVLYTYLNMDQKSDTQYVMKTALSHISFQITDPTFISLQSDPFLLHLIAPCHKTHTNSKRHNHKSFCFKGLRVLQQSNAYFYFRPSP